MYSNDPAMGESQFSVNFTLARPLNGSVNLASGMVRFRLTENIYPEVLILLAKLVPEEFSNWVEAHRVGSGQYALSPLPSDGEPQQILINGPTSRINETFPVPQNVKAQQLYTKSLLLEVLSLEIKIEAGACKGYVGQPCEGKNVMESEVP